MIIIDIEPPVRLTRIICHCNTFTLCLGQRNPKNRVQALYYLGLCFKAKKQYDLAMDQLGTASAEILIMDSSKKDVLYELGQVSELMGDSAKAAEFYKEIYQSDISYRDVSQKIEDLYAAG